MTTPRGQTIDLFVLLISRFHHLLTAESEIKAGRAPETYGEICGEWRALMCLAQHVKHKRTYSEVEDLSGCIAKYAEART